MVRPRKCRRVAGDLPVRYFKPQGMPIDALEEIWLASDELEAMRLTDIEGLYQVEAAERMEVSRQTLGTILASAHTKVARALLEGKALRVGDAPEDARGCRVEIESARQTNQQAVFEDES